MKKIAKVSGLALIALLAMSMPVAAQANVAGNWTMIVEAPEAPGEIVAVFAQDGAKVTGTLDVPMVGGAEMSEGMVEEDTFSFLLEVDMEGQWFTIEVEAEVDGDEMVGEFYIAEFGSIPFSAVRSEG